MFNYFKKYFRIFKIYLILQIKIKNNLKQITYLNVHDFYKNQSEFFFLILV